MPGSSPGMTEDIARPSVSLMLRSPPEFGCRNLKLALICGFRVVSLPIEVSCRAGDRTRMSVNSSDQKGVIDFFNAISGWKEAYPDSEATFSYIAFKANDRFVLTQGALSLNTTKALAPSKFESEHIRAERLLLSTLN